MGDFCANDLRPKRFVCIIFRRIIAAAGKEQRRRAGRTMRPKKGYEGITIGIYRLTTEDERRLVYGKRRNRHSGIREVVRVCRATGATVVIYEPALMDGCLFYGCKLINDLAEFKRMCDGFVVNRYSSDLDDLKGVVLRRDLLVARDGEEAPG